MPLRPLALLRLSLALCPFWIFAVSIRKGPLNGLPPKAGLIGWVDQFGRRRPARDHQQAGGGDGRV